MKSIINLYSQTPGQIQSFLTLFFSQNIQLSNDLFWENSYDNPIDMIELVSCFMDNKDKFKINLWISFDEGVFVNVTDNNLENIIKYIYARFPN